MKFKKTRLFIVLAFIPLLFCGKTPVTFKSQLPENVTRVWAGPEYWANRLQDWQINNGRIECVDGRLPLRTLHLLTRSIEPVTGDIITTVNVGVLSAENTVNADDWCGFLIGAGSDDMDYRARAIIHLCSGENGGLAAAINGEGRIVFFDNEKDLAPITTASSEGEPVKLTAEQDIQLSAAVKPDGDKYSIIMTATNAKTGELLNKASIDNVDAARLSGNIALVANGGADAGGRSFWFKKWQVSGSKMAAHDERTFGPVLCSMFTLSKKTLKMTAQMPPLAENDPQTAILQISEMGQNNWRTVSEGEMIVPGWTIPFRVENWDDGKDYDYRIVYTLPLATGPKDFVYTGVIPKNPVDRDEFIIAAFTGNSNSHGTFRQNYSFSNNRIWFPHKEIVDHVKKHHPDFLVYTGDQVYDGRPTSPDVSGEMSSYYDYLYKWYMFCWAHGELARDIPIVCMPDDHDVFHGNVWGAGGRKAPKAPMNGIYPAHYKGFEVHWQQDQGGYKMPPDFVKMVDRTQTSHLPDPFDPTPILQGIGVYYTDINYGGISFAVLEDRKFKSAPSVVIPEGKVINGFLEDKNFDIHKADVPGAKLLGDRQLKFLRDWAADWQGAWMKIALSQTVLATVSTYPDSFRTDAGTTDLKPIPEGVIPPNYSMSRDMDSNGWPQTGRNKALDELRKGFAFTIAGDQHLGSIVHHGIDEWDDAGYSLCVPSIANLWPRRWYPPNPGLNHQNGMPDYTGSYLDGFGNHITVWAVSNPVLSNHEPATLHDRAPGYGIVKLNKKQQTITMECWPRYADPDAPDAKQYTGWPKTITVADNYGRQAIAFLPVLQFTGLEYPVVQVVDESNNEIVYTVRAKGNSFKPKVFKSGTYTLIVGEPGTDKMKTLKGINSIGLTEEMNLPVEF
ncbi:alkaline phosphatase D family protein [candidate division KSB1 bacterium]|nr:alkaline phosphatase D family protein [candidate division KSB1 bacterium]